MEKSIFTAAYGLFTKRLKELRRRVGLTQRALAKKLKREQNYVARVEIGNRRLDPVEFVWYCEALGVAPEKVFAEFYREMRAPRKPKR